MCEFCNGKHCPYSFSILDWILKILDGVLKVYSEAIIKLLEWFYIIQKE